MAEHTDDMNDMVLLGVDRDSWKARAERLQALNAELLAALKAATVPVANPAQHYCEDWDEWYSGIRAAAIARAESQQ